MQSLVHLFSTCAQMGHFYVTDGSPMYFFMLTQILILMFTIINNTFQKLVMQPKKNSYIKWPIDVLLQNCQIQKKFLKEEGIGELILKLLLDQGKTNVRLLFLFHKY